MRNDRLLVAGFPAAGFRERDLEIPAFGSGWLELVYGPIFLGAEMAEHKRWQEIPTELSLERFREFVLPHLSAGSPGGSPDSTARRCVATVSCGRFGRRQCAFAPSPALGRRFAGAVPPRV